MFDVSLDDPNSWFAGKGRSGCHEESIGSGLSGLSGLWQLVTVQGQQCAEGRRPSAQTLVTFSHANRGCSVEKNIAAVFCNRQRCGQSSSLASWKPGNPWFWDDFGPCFCRKLAISVLGWPNGPDSIVTMRRPRRYCCCVILPTAAAGGCRCHEGWADPEIFIVFWVHTYIRTLTHYIYNIYMYTSLQAEECIWMQALSFRGYQLNAMLWSYRMCFFSPAGAVFLFKPVPAPWERLKTRWPVLRSEVPDPATGELGYYYTLPTTMVIYPLITPTAPPKQAARTVIWPATNRHIAQRDWGFLASENRTATFRQQDVAALLCSFWQLFASHQLETQRPKR